MVRLLSSKMIQRVNAHALRCTVVGRLPPKFYVLEANNIRCRVRGIAGAVGHGEVVDSTGDSKPFEELSKGLCVGLDHLDCMDCYGNMEPHAWCRRLACVAQPTTIANTPRAAAQRRMPGSVR